MKKKKQTTNEKYSHMTTIWVPIKTQRWLKRQCDRMNKRGVGNVLESMIELIKFHKMEEELR